MKKPCERNLADLKDDESNRQLCKGRTVLREKKKLFDKQHVLVDPDLYISKTRTRSICNLYDPKKHFSLMIIGSKPTTPEVIYLCDWYPELFGIDEDEIPFSEDEEGIFDIDWDELEFKTKSETELEEGVEPEEHKKKISPKYVWPKYGRRARQKPILERQNHEKFECLCHIDENYSRHFIPPFDTEFPKDDRDFKPPQYRNVWEDYCYKIRGPDSDEWSASEEPQESTEPLFQSPPKLPCSTMKDIKKFRKQLLAQFRPMDRGEIRRYRLPYAEALYFELQEDQCFDGAEFFKNLIIKDNIAHETILALGPYLRDDKIIMKQIVRFLKLADKYYRKGDYHKAVTVILKSGKYLNDRKSCWWLAEEFYLKAVKDSQKSVLDGGEAQALAHFMLGIFFFEFGNKVYSAQEHFIKAKELSEGKDWTAKNIIRSSQDSLHEECTAYLLRTLIAISKELREKGKPEEALSYIHQLQKLYEDSLSQRWDVETEILFESGKTYQAVGNLDLAITAFKKQVAIALKQNCTRKLFEGYLELAICYRSLGDLTLCQRYLQSYRKSAETEKHENLTAFENRYLGEFHLNNNMTYRWSTPNRILLESKANLTDPVHACFNRHLISIRVIAEAKGNSKKAAEHLKKAFYSFHKQWAELFNIPYAEWKPEHFTLQNDLELTRVLTGLAEGESLTKPVCRLILNVKDKNDQQELQKLLRWKHYQIIEVTEESEKKIPDKHALFDELKHDVDELLEDLA